jgi:hypothetical protein
MRIVLATIVVLTAFALSLASCKSSSGNTFCDTACLKDTIKYMNDNHPLKPYVHISATDCKPDTVSWSYDGMGVTRKMDISGLVGAPVHLNKDFTRCVFNDTSYAFLVFNDCNGGRGYYLKIPFNKTKSLGRSNRAINAFDPKYAVEGDLLSYIDPGNIFVEDMKTGKTAMMTFGRDIAPDYANIHNTIDSVNITPSRVWVKFKVDNEWKEMEKKIELK